MAKPGAPSNLRFTRQSGRDITLLFDAGTGAVDYGIQMGPRNETPVTRWYTSSRSFPVKRMGENSSFTFRVFSRNKDGNSAYSNTVRVYTPPTKPGKPTLTRSPVGVLVTWGSTAYYQAGAVVERSDGASFVVGSGIGGLVTQYLDTSLGGVGIKYRVRHFVGAAGATTRVFSDWSPWSDAITSLLPPAAPILTAPKGVIPLGVVSLVWAHNSLDSSTQTAAQVSITVAGGGGATVLNVGSSEKVDHTFASPGLVEWRVRTKGMYEGWGPWSATSVFRVASAPIVTITAPSGAVDSPFPRLTWVTGQGEGLPQSAWEAVLLVNDVEVDRASGSNAGKSHVFSYPLADGDAARIRVRVSTQGVWSTWVQTIFGVAFRPPQPPTGRVVWDEGAGAFEVTIKPGSFTGVGTVSAVEMVAGRIVAHRGTPPSQPTGLAVVGGRPVFNPDRDGWMVTLPMSLPPTAILTPFALLASSVDPTASLSIQRSINGGATWEVVGEGLAAQEVTVLDFQAPSTGTTRYRLTAHTDLGATSSITLVGVADSPAFWVGAGDDFSQTCRLLYGENQPPTLSIRGGRERARKHYAGRSWPVSYTGEALTRSFTLTGVLAEGDVGNTTQQALLDLMMADSEVFVLRSPVGTRVYASPNGDVSVDRSKRGLWGFTISFDEVGAP